MVDEISVYGVTADSNRRWVCVKRQAQRAWVPLDEFSGRGVSAIDTLKRQGFVVVRPKLCSMLIEKVAQLHNFPPLSVIEHVGWSGGHFALPDGAVFSPSGVSAGPVTFESLEGKCSQKGKLKDWRNGVAKPLARQSIPMFAITLAFVAPLLRLTERVGNFGFELVGGKGVGKSTVQQLMASVLGGALQGADGHYWIRFDTTLNAIEKAMTVHADLPLFLKKQICLSLGSLKRSGATCLRHWHSSSLPEP